MFVDRHRAACQAVAKSRLLDLPTAAADCHRVVLLDDPLGLDTEDPVQIAPAGPPECRPFLRRRHAELAVELRDVPVPQKAIGPLDRFNSRQAKLLRQPPLPRPKTPL